MSLIWNSAKAKVQLRLSVQRLRTLQQKKEAQAKASRRDIASLLERGKTETARIKVETIINEDIYLELLELLELYCELLLARFGLLDQNMRTPDPAIAEGVCSVIHAAPRTELKELHILRDLLMHKFGREFSLSVMENRDGCVSNRVVSKLSVATPPPVLVDAYLREIAKAYGVSWSTPDELRSANPDEDVKESLEDDNPAKASDKKQQEEEKEDNDNDNDGKDRAKEKSQDGSATTAMKPTETKASSPSPGEDEFDLLAKRFAELKRR